MMQLFVIRVQESINMKEMWATETQNTVMPKGVCLISNSLSDEVLLSKSTLGNKGKDMDY